MRRLMFRLGLCLLIRSGLFEGWIEGELKKRSSVAAALLSRAEVLCFEQEATSSSGTSGEYKRHNVYARLIKDFPAISKREISKAIEQGLPE
jgi:hypothetical protein